MIAGNVAETIQVKAEREEYWKLIQQGMAQSKK